MPFPFALPTTSSVLLLDFLASPSHPSLSLEATTKRSVLKDALKKYKRLPAQSRASGLSAIQDALTNYIPYLLALSTGAGCLDVGNERVDVEVLTPLTVEWRSTLGAALPGREAPRPKLTGLHHEIAFVFSTLAYTQSLLARQQLSTLHSSTPQSADQRTAATSAALKYLLEAYNIHTYLLTIPSVSAARDGPPDIQPSTISALASLALAEAWLVVVSKDDPYAAAVAEERDSSNKDWMFKAPTIPKVRAHLYARLCLAAADHAGTASGLISGARIDDGLLKYVGDLRKTARGKAARFLAIDTELSGKTGEALAWLKGAKKELGLAMDSLEDGKRKGLRGLKHSWQEKREDRRAEKGGEWGLDAGRLEEARVVEMLEAKWERENSTVNVQVVPAWEPLLAGMPSGRDYPKPEAYRPPVLEGSVLGRLRAPVDEGRKAWSGEEADSGDEGEAVGGGFGRGAPVGAFPGSEAEYGARSGTSNSYY